eukprot:11199249-Lingulodinium_polyedra.AAC.1
MVERLISFALPDLPQEELSPLMALRGCPPPPAVPEWVTPDLLEGLASRDEITNLKEWMHKKQHSTCR